MERQFKRSEPMTWKATEFIFFIAMLGLTFSIIFLGGNAISDWERRTRLL